MKKMVLASLLAVTALALSVQNASAWHEFRFSAGFDIQCKGGGNRFLWGLCDSGPYPPCGTGCGPDACLPCPPCPPMGFGGMPMMADPNCLPGAPVPPAAAPKAGQPQGKPASAEYQPVGYSSPTGYNYPYSAYQYYYGNNTGYQVPSYWYGN